MLYYIIYKIHIAPPAPQWHRALCCPDSHMSEGSCVGVICLVSFLFFFVFYYLLSSSWVGVTCFVLLSIIYYLPHECLMKNKNKKYKNKKRKKKRKKNTDIFYSQYLFYNVLYFEKCWKHWHFLFTSIYWVPLECLKTLIFNHDCRFSICKLSQG